MDGSEKGFVSLVGAGPGDEGLITVRGVERLEQAEVVVYDYLANSNFLDMCRPECEKIYVGKRAGSHTLKQEEINRLLVEHARRGKAVVRLKGGDPFIFGRGGEEALYLAREGISFEVVPGVTAGSAAAAYAGIPVTHRGLSNGVTFVTGHGAAQGPEAQEQNWKNLAQSDHTLVVYMGVKNLPTIVEALMRHGRAADTPAAIISWGTTVGQRVVSASLETLAARAQAESISPPAIAVIGQVAALREKIRWFEERPLFGSRILVTRSSDDAKSLSVPLRALGAEVIELPSIKISPVEDFSELDDALQVLSRYRWIVFTSPKGVGIFFSRLFSLGSDARALAESKVACIGTGTAAELSAYGIRVDLVPELFTSEGLAQAFKERKGELLGEYVLFPVSEIARDLVPNALTSMGARCSIVPIYTVSKPVYSREEIERAFEPFPDLVSITSSSTVHNLVALLEEHELGAFCSRMRGASIGPVTSRTAEELGISVVTEAKEHSIPGLIEGIRNFAQKTRERNA